MQLKILFLILLLLPFLSSSSYALSAIIPLNESYLITSGTYYNAQQFNASSAFITLYSPINTLYINNESMTKIQNGTTTYFIYNFTPSIVGTYNGFVTYYNGSSVLYGEWDEIYVENIAQQTKKEVGVMELAIVIFLIVFCFFIFYVCKKLWNYESKDKNENYEIYAKSISVSLFSFFLYSLSFIFYLIYVWTINDPTGDVFKNIFLILSYIISITSSILLILSAGYIIINSLKHIVDKAIINRGNNNV